MFPHCPSNSHFKPPWQSRSVVLQTYFIGRHGGKIVVRIVYHNNRDNVLDSTAGILILNVCLILPLLSSTLNGIDSSMLNGQSRTFAVVDGQFTLP